MALAALVLPLALTLRPLPAPARAAVPAMALSAETLARDPFQMTIDLAPRGKCNLKFKPTFEKSESVMVKYYLPFNLNIENKGGRAVVTKAGEGGEQPGDVLRYCTQWTLQPPQEGTLGGSIGAIGGLLKWQLGLMDVGKAQAWQEVVDALVSHTPERTDNVVLVFERPLD